MISFVQIMIRGQLSSGQNLKGKILLDEKHPRYTIHCTYGGVGVGGRGGVIVTSTNGIMTVAID